MSAKDLDMAYQQVVEMMEQLYTVCHLVHADLSEYNILWYEKEAWFIDVSQAVEPIHPSGLDFLLRDCTNVFNVRQQPSRLVFTTLLIFSICSSLVSEALTVWSPMSSSPR